MIALLISKGANVKAVTVSGWTALHRAAETGAPARIIELLVSKGADVNRSGAPDCWDHAAPLHKARTKEVAQALMANGARVDERDRYGLTPLHRAALYDRRGVVEVLIDNGADVNARDDQWGERSAVYAGKTSEGERIYEYRVNSNAGGHTPLHYAAWCGHEAIVQVLLDSGADIDVRTNGNQTPLDYAKSAGHAAIVELLRTHDG